MATERLQVILELQSGQYNRSAREAATATSKIAGKADEASTATGKLGDKFSGLASTAKIALAGAATAAVGAFVTGSVRAASDLGESVNAVQKVFGDASGRVLEFGKVAAETAGLSAREFNELATNTGSLLTNMGFGFDDAAKQSIRLTSRAADLASVFNVDVGEALGAINAGLRGETEPLRRFGIQLSDQAIRAKAVELGLADTTAAVDTHGKAVAALELIYDQSSKAQGDFIQTSDSLANRLRQNQAEFENAQAAFGEAAVPIASGALDVATTTLLSFRTLFGDTTAEMQIRMREAIQNITQAAKEGTLTTADLANSLLHVAENGDLTADQFYTLAAAAGLSDDQFGIFKDSVVEQAQAMGIDQQVIDEMAAAIDGASESSSDAAGATDGLTNSTGELADAAEQAAQAQRDLNQAALEAVNPAVGASGALDRMREAQSHLEEVQKDNEATAQDVAQAQLDYGQSVLEAQAALDKFSAAGPEGSIDALAQALGIADEDAQAILETLGLLDGKVVTSTVRVVQKNEAVGIRNTLGRSREQRAHGGDVQPGRFYQVGEGNQAEVAFIPGDRGSVFSNSDTKRILSAFDSLSRGGGGTTINLAVSGVQGERVENGVRRGLAAASFLRAAS